jgi:hypothetical protein
MNRYVNVTLITTEGSAMSTQILSKQKGIGEALEYVESQMTKTHGPHQHYARTGFVASFIFDTNTRKLYCYSITGFRAKLLKEVQS